MKVRGSVLGVWDILGYDCEVAIRGGKDVEKLVEGVMVIILGWVMWNGSELAKDFVRVTGYNTTGQDERCSISFLNFCTSSIRPRDSNVLQ